MKKILLLGNNLYKGNPTTIKHLSEILKAADFNVLVYSNKKNKLFRLLDMCWAIIKHNNADYILIDTYSTFNFYYAFITSQLARVLHIKYIPILHGGNLPSRLKNSPFLSNCIFNNSYVNVSPSKYLLNEFLKFGFKSILIPNAIKIQLYPFTQRTTFTPKLLWVRAFDKIYNPKMAVEVLLELKKTLPNAELCMVGPDKDGSLQEVMEYAKLKNIESAIEFTGLLSKSEWKEKSKNYSFFINTTNFDNMPVSLIEAMVLGLPVISTNVGGIPYLIEANKTGILVEKNDVLKMAASIKNSIENPAIVVEITKNARKQAAMYDEEIVKTMWLKILYECYIN